MLRICVPASTANLGPGFDCLGMALSLFNYLEVEQNRKGSIHIEVRGEGEKSLPRGPDNLVPRVMASLFSRVGLSLPGLRLRLENNVPIGKGLGSSAAAVAAALVAANSLAGNPFGSEELVELGTEWEGHPDNMAAAILGGVVVTAQHQEKVAFRRFDPPGRLRVVVAVPDFSLPTSESRKALPTMVPMADAVFNIGRIGLLMMALLKDDLDLLPMATGDRLHQPYRASLVPGLMAVFQAAREAGALGVCLSGAGPAVLALVTDQESQVGETMCNAFRSNGVECQVWNLSPSLTGARIISI